MEFVEVNICAQAGSCDSLTFDMTFDYSLPSDDFYIDSLIEAHYYVNQLQINILSKEEGVISYE